MGGRLKEPVGVAHGRFQPLHAGHVEYLLAAKASCDLLLVGITNPDPWQMAFEPTDPGRGEADANPFTYYERYLMVEGALIENDVSRDEFRIIPFPHSHPERLRYYLPADPLMLMTIYDEWGETKLRRFQDMGLRVRVLWRREDKVTTGTAVREAIRAGLPWEDRVPRATALAIRESGAGNRIRKRGTS